MARHSRLTIAAIMVTGVGMAWAFSDAQLPSYLSLVAGEPAGPPTADRIAATNVLTLNSAMMPIYNRALQRFQANMKQETPILLAMFTGAGGKFILYRPGHGAIVADSPPIDYQLVKSCGHSAMAIYELTAPYLGNSRMDKSWQAPMKTFLTQHSTALETIHDLKVSAEVRAIIEKILRHNVAFMERCLEEDAFTYQQLSDFGRQFKPMAEAAIAHASQVQVSHWMNVLDGWKAELGEDWDRLYAATNSLYVTRQNNILFSVLVQYLGKEAINQRLFLFETTEFTTTEDQLLDLLTRIVADRSLGMVYFGDYYLMDSELLGSGARRAIEAGCKERGMTPVLPPLVPFNSTAWPWRADPKSGTGPATLEDVRYETSTIP